MKEISLQKRIKHDQTQARKSQDKKLALILGTLFAEVQRAGKDAGNRESTDQEAELVIAKFLKDLKISFKHFTGMDIQNFKYVVAENEVDEKMKKSIDMYSEAKIYESYLPEPLTQEKQADEIANLIKNGSDNIGQIMQYFSAKYRGMYDGKELKDLALKMIKEANENGEV